MANRNMLLFVIWLILIARISTLQGENAKEKRRKLYFWNDLPNLDLDNWHLLEEKFERSELHSKPVPRVLQKADEELYEEEEKEEICKKVWSDLDSLKVKYKKDMEHCLKLIKDVYIARRLIPTAEFDITPAAMLYVNEYSYEVTLNALNGINDEKNEKRRKSAVIEEFGEKIVVDEQFIANDQAKSIKFKNAHKSLLSKETVPQTFDLRSEFGNFKNGGSCIYYPLAQGECGDCYNYSALSAIEGSICRQLGYMIPQLSPQHSIDCWLGAKNGAADVCYGGQTFDVFKIAAANKLCTLRSYPELSNINGEVGKCKANCEKCASITNWYWNFTASTLTYDDPWSVITSAVYNYGPVTASICTKMPGFNVYLGGFYKIPTCGTWWCGRVQVDHAISLVGYGVTTYGIRYYILKNTWGKNWGKQGFMNISADICSTIMNPGWITKISESDITENCKISEKKNVATYIEI